MTGPTRSQPVARHRCRCLLEAPPDCPVVGDRCPAMIDNPDQPVCDDCLADHVPLAHFRMLPVP